MSVNSYIQIEAALLAYCIGFQLVKKFKKYVKLDKLHHQNKTRENSLLYTLDFIRYTIYNSQLKSVQFCMVIITDSDHSTSFSTSTAKNKIHCFHKIQGSEHFEVALA